MRIILAALGFVLLGLVIVYSLSTQSISIQDDIKNRVVKYFESEGGNSDVSLTTDGRDVTLEGSVSSNKKRARLGSMASAVEGVRAVKNKLLVNSDNQNADVKDESNKATEILSIVKNAINKNIAKVKKKVNSEEVAKIKEKVVKVKKEVVKVKKKILATPKKVLAVKAPEKNPSKKSLLLNRKVELVELDTKSVRSCFQRFADTLSSGNVQFESASFDINSKSFPLLDSLAETSKECENTQIKIMGFADSKAKPSEKKSTGIQRAQAVASYLVSKGVVGNRIKTSGLSRSADRKIEITIEENL